MHFRSVRRTGCEVSWGLSRETRGTWADFRRFHLRITPLRSPSLLDPSREMLTLARAEQAFHPPLLLPPFCLSICKLCSA